MYEPTCLLAINHLLGESHVLGSNNDRRHSEIIDSSMLEVNPDKFEHTRYIPKEFEWLIPIPGDWHMMMNLR